MEYSNKLKAVKSISFIICVLNEVERAPKALDDLMKSIEGRSESIEIIIIDNNSTDGTKDWMKQLDHSVVKTIYNETNLGKGGSIKKGIALSTGEYVIIHDPDMEYIAADIWLVLNHMIQSGAALGLGSRLIQGKIRTQYVSNYLGVVFLSKLIGLLYSSDLTDTATALKIFVGDTLRSLKLQSNGFDLDFELVTRVLRSGQKITEYPIQYYPRSIAEGKKIRIIDGFKALKVIIRDRFISKNSILKS